MAICARTQVERFIDPDALSVEGAGSDERKKGDTATATSVDISEGKRKVRKRLSIMQTQRKRAIKRCLSVEI